MKGVVPNNSIVLEGFSSYPLYASQMKGLISHSIGSMNGLYDEVQAFDSIQCYNRVAFSSYLQKHKAFIEICPIRSNIPGFGITAATGVTPKRVLSIY